MSEHGWKRQRTQNVGESIARVFVDFLGLYINLYIIMINYILLFSCLTLVEDDEAIMKHAGLYNELLQQLCADGKTWSVRIIL